MLESNHITKDKDSLRFLEHHNHYTDQKLRRILRDVKTFALVGASTVWRRPSYYAMTYLQHKGFKIIPINPARVGETVLGEKVYGSLADVPHQLDMVDIFRTSEEALDITKDVIKNKDARGIKYLWMPKCFDEKQKRKYSNLIHQVTGDLDEDLSRQKPFDPISF